MRLITPNSKQRPLDIFDRYDILYLKIYIFDSSPYKFQKNVLDGKSLAILPESEQPPPNVGVSELDAFPE